MDVLDDLGTDMFVEFAGQGAVLHEEILLDGWGGDLYVKRLVLDEDVTCVALNVGPHDDGPCFDEAVLVVGGLNTVDAHELLNNGVDSFYIAFSHGRLSGMI